MKTYTAKPGEIQREWFLVDAEGQTLGRLATQIATGSAARASRSTHRTSTRVTSSSS
jgi:ribosomal protein L13